MELQDLATVILDALESPGQVKATHPAIRSLKREIDRRRAERARFSQEFIHSSAPLMQNDQPVFRDGRVVLPVRSDMRGSD
jgi:DNA mismatch repair protein MutS2